MPNERYIMYKYGLTLEQYDKMLEEQNYVCAICQGLPGAKGFHVDHSARNGKVRGLLCGRCNSGIGMLQHAPRILAAAIVYLESHGEKW